LKNKNEIANRTWIVFAFICVIGLAIFGKIIYIQTAEASKWEERAQRYEQQVRDIEPTRGQIYSSDGSLLATSVPVYDVYWDSKSSAIDQEVFLAELDSLCIDLQNYFGDKSKAEYKQLLLEAQRKGDRYFRVKKNLKYTEMKVVREFHFIRRGKFKSGFIFDRKDIRKKPFGKLAARTIGIDRHGSRVGLELAYNEELAGKSGKQLMERIAGDVWKPVTDSYITPPEEGLDIVSTINVHLQDVAANALEKQLVKHNALWGTVVLMEVETGYIRAISNLSRDAETGEYHESFNYAVAETVEPGSTFKLASLMAAMDDGHVELEELVDTGIGVKYFSGEDMHDSNEKEGGNGIITAEQVFEKSSNIGTATLIDKYYP
jgi:cell division protein FtsI (penicillin-binding protein 3)